MFCKGTCLTCWTTAQCAAFCQQCRTRGTMDSTIDTTTAKQAAVRRIDNRIDIECCNIRLYDRDHFSDPL